MHISAFRYNSFHAAFEVIESGFLFESPMPLFADSADLDATGKLSDLRASRLVSQTVLHSLVERCQPPSQRPRRKCVVRPSITCAGRTTGDTHAKGNEAATSGPLVRRLQHIFRQFAGSSIAVSDIDFGSGIEFLEGRPFPAD